MAFSIESGKAFTTHVVRELALQGLITSVLDIGIGYGIYSEMFRRLCRAEWVGVDIWAPYLSTYQLETKYDRVIIGDARFVDFAALRDHFDVAFLGDVLEHVTQDDAAGILSRVTKTCSIAIVSIPIVYAPQGEYEGNPFETHVYDDWSHDKVLSWLPHICCWHIDMPIGVYIATRDTLWARTIKTIAQSYSPPVQVGAG